MEYKLSDLFELQMGKTPSRNNADYWNTKDNDWISIGDLSVADKYVYETKEKLSDKAIKESGIKVIPQNTVIMSFKLSIGKVAITPREMFSNEAIMAFIDKKVVNILPEYLYYLFLHKNWDEGTNKAVMGKTLNKATLSNMTIQIHDFTQQKEISRVLNKVNKIICDRKKQLVDMDNLVKSRFVEMFGDPIENPMGWECKSLSECSVKITNGNTPKGGNENYVDNGIAFFRSQNVWKNRLVVDDIAYIDRETHASMKESSLKYGDILITKTGRINTENSSLGRSAIYLGEDDNANINGHVYLVRLKDEMNRVFVLNILIGDSYREHIRRVCVGGIDKRQLNRNHIEDFPIINPPIDLQSEFADFVHATDKLKLASNKMRFKS